MRESFRFHFFVLWILLGAQSLIESGITLALYENVRLSISAPVYVIVFFAAASLRAVILAVVAAVLERVLGGSSRARCIVLAIVLTGSLLADTVPTWASVFPVYRMRPVAVGSLVVLLVGAVVFALVVGGVATRLWDRAHRSAVRAMAITLVVLTGGVAAAGFVRPLGGDGPTVHPPPEFPASDGRSLPDTVVIVSFDALRADHLSLYGYGRDTSPELDAVGRDALRFDQAMTPKGRTGPSLGSLLTGLYPVRHGALRHGWPIPQDIPTLPKLLAHHYETAAFVANPVVEDTTHVAGFDFVKIFDRTPAEAVFAEAREWLAERMGQPALVWVHLWEPHSPYEPPQEDIEPFVDDDYYDVASRIPYSTEVLMTPGGAGIHLEDNGTDPRDRVNRLAAAYDGSVRFATRAAGEFLAWVRSQRETPLIVVTSDHGESMVEHDEFFWHGNTTYQPVMRVPLLISYEPEDLRGTSDRPASLVDILPTLCGLVGCNEAVGFDGIDLLAETPAKPRAVFSCARDNPLYTDWAILKDGWKLVLSPVRALAPLDGRVERRARLWGRISRSAPSTNPLRYRLLRAQLYDLNNDPGELENLADVEVERRRELEQELLAWLDMQYVLGRETGYLDENRRISDAMQRRLRSLGYTR